MSPTAAVSNLVAALHPLLQEIATEDSMLVELSSIISDPGALRQPLHSDTAWAPWPLYTIFVALQDIKASMGPTQVVPGSHTEEQHRGCTQGAGGDASTVRDLDSFLMTCGAGDGFVMDSRLYHCGGANLSDQRRRVLCVSFAVPYCEPPGSTYSLLWELRGKFRLKHHTSWFSTVHGLAPPRSPAS